MSVPSSLSFVRTTIIAASLLTTLSSAGFARFMRPELVDVPLSRMILNLTAQAERAPKDAELQQHLARTHAMAYVKDIGGDTKVQKTKEKDGPWFGFTPPHVPYAPRTTDSEAKAKSEEAKKHLTSALEHYENAARLDQDNLQIALGLAWCHEQAGNKDAAMTGYRQVIKGSWKKEGEARTGGLRSFMTVEAIGYLIPLLDEQDHAEEIADLNAKRGKLTSLPRPMTPIAIPLQDGTKPGDMISRDAEVTFDLDGTGRALAWQWIQADQAAWLVHDPRETGKVTSSIQMFGSRTFNLFFEHGYQALALLDDDQNGFIRGAELTGLALWNDRNSNGVSDEGEVRPLAAYRISGLACAASKNTNGIYWSHGGVEYADGSHSSSYDLVMEPVSQPD